jgi:DNA (cytosine-5)-methyltransferase 1
MPTLISLYSGGGVADIGFRDAGFDLVAAIERDPKIAHYHNLNLGDHCINAAVSDVDYTQFKGVDVIFMSPPCRASSVANPKRGEDHPDWLLGNEAIRSIETINPQWVILENVRGYADNPAFKAICAALQERDYYFDYRVLDCADLGVPQHRKRLILLASRDGFFLFPQFVELWQTWYGAIEDLIDDCEDSTLPNWARKLLSERGLIKERLLVNDRNTFGSPICGDNRPCFTLTARYGHRVLLPAHDNKFNIKKLSSRAIARLMSVPDDYVLPDQKCLATTILGNGFPTAAARRLGEWILNQSNVL